MALVWPVVLTDGKKRIELILDPRQVVHISSGKELTPGMRVELRHIIWGTRHDLEEKDCLDALKQFATRIGLSETSP